MQLRHSQRRAAKMRLALQGASGSGKTYSSLLIAYGMTGDWSKIAVIDSENCSADLYAHLGGYQVLTLENYAPETYIEAIGICEQAGAEVIIIDSISHCWDYLLDFHANLQGNSFANWAKVTPRQNAFIQRILTSSAHVICTMRSKQDYVLSDKNGKKKFGIAQVESIFVNHPVASAKMVTDSVTDYRSSCNLNHEAWGNPWDPTRVSTASFVDLFHETLDKCSRVYALLNSAVTDNMPLDKQDLSPLLAELGNESYHSGLPVE